MKTLTQITLAACLGLAVSKVAAAPAHLSGIYPSLATFNNEAECGTGAVVPWANRLWVVSYAPHAPGGSSDKLYEITPDLQQIVRQESIGGTPANRMIHRESGQLFIGPYAIDSEGRVRVIPYTNMFGRPTGNARHLTDPAGKIYYATMEEGFYEVDVRTLQVKVLYDDTQTKNGIYAGLPGYHGKGFYSGQGRVIYGNNGENGAEAQKRPDVPSGCLAEWDGRNWTVVRRNQFTEVTGPGGIYGNENPQTDPIWSIGWDHRSLILMVRENGSWHTYRLPKSSHSYDGAHGWNTEWPRIRDIGEKDLLMTMHGAFWRFPRSFSSRNSAGIAPRSNYLKVIGDFCRWKDRIVFGCDDTAKSEFLNKRKAKGEIAAPQSQSNLWFVEPDELDRLGPVIGRGGVWVTEDVPANTHSDPFLIRGYERRGLHLAHEGAAPATFIVEVDQRGNGDWKQARRIELPPNGNVWTEIRDRGVWMRLSSPTPLKRATAWFQYSNRDPRSPRVDRLFQGVATADDSRVTGGLMRARAENKRTLAFAAMAPASGQAQPAGYYELDHKLKLRPVDDPESLKFTLNNTRIPVGVLEVDQASVIFVADDGKRWRLPKGDPALDQDGVLGPGRVDREVATERDLFNAHGTMYELPAQNAGGFSLVRPIATHNRRIHDYCSYRGLFLISGINLNEGMRNPHIIRSDDGKAALWGGAIDDVWKLGTPRGTGGPWYQTAVKANHASDPYLMTGYDVKKVTISHKARSPVEVTLETDVTGTGLWLPYRTFSVAPGKRLNHTFPAAFSAYWVRARTSQDAVATVQFTYE